MDGFTFQAAKGQKESGIRVLCKQPLEEQVAAPVTRRLFSPPRHVPLLAPQLSLANHL